MKTRLSCPRCKTDLGPAVAGYLKACGNCGLEFSDGVLPDAWTTEPFDAPKGCPDLPGSAFRVGDLVQLKSGGPAMTLSATHGCGSETAEVVFWAAGKSLHIEELPMACLRHYIPEEDIPF